MLAATLLELQRAEASQPFFTSPTIAWLLLSLCVIAAGGAVYWILRRNLEPIETVIKQAAALDPRRLDQRIKPLGAGHRIDELVKVINAMLDRLETEFKNQQRFFSHVSHELRTPLSVLMMESKAIREKLSQSSELRDYVVAVEEESARLHRIVDAFLILTRAASGIRPTVEVSVPAEELVLESIRRCRAYATERNIRIVPKLNFDGGHDPTVAGDVELLCSALENILDNAIRHSPDGGSVDVQARVDDGKISFIIADEGEGVPDECMDRIFELFFRASKKNPTNLGVGLSIAQAVARLHGGTISVHNLPNKGCKFTFAVPVSFVSS